MTEPTKAAREGWAGGTGQGEDMSRLSVVSWDAKARRHLIPGVGRACRGVLGISSFLRLSGDGGRSVLPSGYNALNICKYCLSPEHSPLV